MASLCFFVFSLLMQVVLFCTAELRGPILAEGGSQQRTRNMKFFDETFRFTTFRSYSSKRNVVLKPGQTRSVRVICDNQIGIVLFQAHALHRDDAVSLSYVPPDTFSTCCDFQASQSENIAQDISRNWNGGRYCGAHAPVGGVRSRHPALIGKCRRCGRQCDVPPSTAGDKQRAGTSFAEVLLSNDALDRTVTVSLVVAGYSSRAPTAGGCALESPLAIFPGLRVGLRSSLEISVEYGHARAGHYSSPFYVNGVGIARAVRRRSLSLVPSMNETISGFNSLTASGSRSTAVSSPSRQMRVTNNFIATLKPNETVELRFVDRIRLPSCSSSYSQLEYELYVRHLRSTDNLEEALEEMSDVRRMSLHAIRVRDAFWYSRGQPHTRRQLFVNLRFRVVLGLIVRQKRDYESSLTHFESSWLSSSTRSSDERQIFAAAYAPLALLGCVDYPMLEICTYPSASIMLMWTIFGLVALCLTLAGHRLLKIQVAAAAGLLSILLFDSVLLSFPQNEVGDTHTRYGLYGSINSESLVARRAASFGAPSKGPANVSDDVRLDALHAKNIEPISGPYNSVASRARSSLHAMNSSVRAIRKQPPFGIATFPSISDDYVPWDCENGQCSGNKINERFRNKSLMSLHTSRSNSINVCNWKVLDSPNFIDEGDVLNKDSAQFSIATFFVGVVAALVAEFFWFVWAIPSVAVLPSGLLLGALFAAIVSYSPLLDDGICASLLLQSVFAFRVFVTASSLVVVALLVSRPLLLSIISSAVVGGFAVVYAFDRLFVHGIALRIVHVALARLSPTVTGTDSRSSIHTINLIPVAEADMALIFAWLILSITGIALQICSALRSRRSFPAAPIRVIKRYLRRKRGRLICTCVSRFDDELSRLLDFERNQEALGSGDLTSAVCSASECVYVGL